MDNETWAKIATVCVVLLYIAIVLYFIFKDDLSPKDFTKEYKDNSIAKEYKDNSIAKEYKDNSIAKLSG